MTRGNLNDKSGTGAGAKFDEYDLGNFAASVGDTEYHSLTKTGIEAGTEQNDIRSTGRLHGHHRSRGYRADLHHSRRPSRPGSTDKDGEKDSETTDHDGE